MSHHETEKYYEHLIESHISLIYCLPTENLEAEGYHCTNPASTSDIYNAIDAALSRGHDTIYIHNKEYK